MPSRNALPLASSKVTTECTLSEPHATERTRISISSRVIQLSRPARKMGILNVRNYPLFSPRKTRYGLRRIQKSKNKQKQRTW